MAGWVEGFEMMQPPAHSLWTAPLPHVDVMAGLVPSLGQLTRSEWLNMWSSYLVETEILLRCSDYLFDFSPQSGPYYC